MADVASDAIAIRIVLLGGNNSGKSCFEGHMVTGRFDPLMRPTIGAALYQKKIQLKDGRHVKFRIWDTAGQEQYDSLAPMYYRKAAAAIVMYDVTSAASFDRLHSWVRELLENGPEDIVIACVGNKVDLLLKAGFSRAVPTADAEAFAHANNASYFEASARTGKNVAEVFASLATEVLRRRGVISGDDTVAPQDIRNGRSPTTDPGSDPSSSSSSSSSSPALPRRILAAPRAWPRVHDSFFSPDPPDGPGLAVSSASGSSQPDSSMEHEAEPPTSTDSAAPVAQQDRDALREGGVGAREIEAATRERDDAIREAEKLTSQLNDCREENARIRAQLATAKEAHNQETSKLRSTVAFLTEDKHQLAESHAKLKESNIEARKSNLALREEVLRLRRELDASKVNVKHAAEEHKRLLAEARRSTKEAVEASMKGDLEAGRKEADDLRLEAQRERERVKGLEGMIKAVRGVESVFEERSMVGAKQEEMIAEARKGNVQAVNASVAAAMAVRQELHGDMRRLQAELEAMQAQIRSQAEDLARRDAVLAKATTTRTSFTKPRLEALAVAKALTGVDADRLLWRVKGNVLGRIQAGTSSAWSTRGWLVGKPVDATMLFKNAASMVEVHCAVLKPSSGDWLSRAVVKLFPAALDAKTTARIALEAFQMQQLRECEHVARVLGVSRDVAGSDGHGHTALVMEEAGCVFVDPVWAVARALEATPASSVRMETAKGTAASSVSSHSSSSSSGELYRASVALSKVMRECVRSSGERVGRGVELESLDSCEHAIVHGGPSQVLVGDVSSDVRSLAGSGLVVVRSMSDLMREVHLASGRLVEGGQGGHRDAVEAAVMDLVAHMVVDVEEGVLPPMAVWDKGVLGTSADPQAVVNGEEIEGVMEEVVPDDGDKVTCVEWVLFPLEQRLWVCHCAALGLAEVHRGGRVSVKAVEASWAQDGKESLSASSSSSAPSAPSAAAASSSSSVPSPPPPSSSSPSSASTAVTEIHDGLGGSATSSVAMTAAAAGVESSSSSSSSSCGFLHRDVKPDNLFVYPNWRVKVGDFGEAKQQAMESLTRGSRGGIRVRGTVDFISPEMWRREEASATPEDKAAANSPATDVYSLGLSMLPMLCLGEPQPWSRRLESEGQRDLSQAQREAAIRERVLKGERPRPRDDLTGVERGVGIKCLMQLNTGAPRQDHASGSDDDDSKCEIIEDWINLMERCWAHDASSRPSSLGVAQELYGLYSRARGAQ